MIVDGPVGAKEDEETASLSCRMGCALVEELAKRRREEGSPEACEELTAIQTHTCLQIEVDCYRPLGRNYRAKDVPTREIALLGTTCERAVEGRSDWI